ncbi:DUF7289 family protein [Halostella salina]|uniref:DUF7289 family protein n=1 Tax=Halostella salina TaxID=1547897 RepID=UPI0013CE93BA|nr:VWA domain-containing protein [Halostella salina]
MLADSGSDNRGVSNTVGIILLFGMVLTGATLVFLVGGMALDATERQSEMRSAEMSMQEVRSDLSSLAARGEGSTRLSVGGSDDGSIRTDGSMSFTIRGQTKAGTTRACTTDLTLSSLRHDDGDGQHVAYQAGGVWRMSEDGESTTIVSPPALSYRTEEINGVEYRTFDFDVANLTGSVDTDGETTASVNQTRSQERRKQITDEMFCRDDDEGDLRQIRSLTIVVRNSTYYDAWGRYLRDRMGDAGSVTVYDNRTVVASDIPLGRQVNGSTPRLASDDLLIAVNDTAGAETSHKLRFDVSEDAEGDTLESVNITYNDDETDLSRLAGKGSGARGHTNPDQTKVHRADGDVVDLKKHLESYEVDTDDGTIEFQFDESVELYSNDTVTVEYGSQTRNGKDGKVTNPGSPGQYNVTATLNGDDDSRRTGTLSIGDVNDGIPGNGTDSDDDGVPDHADRCPDTEGDGRYGCGVVSEDEDANALRVNSSSATLELVGTQVAEERIVNESVAERQPLDVMFVLDRSGSMRGSCSIENVEGSWQEVSADSFDWAHADSTEYVVPRGKLVRIETWGGTNYYTPGSVISHPIIGDIAAIDVELSCSGSDPDNRRVDATRSFVGALNASAGDRAGVVEFNSDSKLLSGLTDDLDDVNDSATGAADGGTDMGSGLYEAVDQFDDDAGNERVAVLLSDGRNDGPGNLNKRTRRAAEEAAENNVTVYTIGLGSGADEDLLTDVADETGGEYYYVDDDSELEEQFEAIAGNVTRNRVRQVEHKAVEASVKIGGSSYPLNLSAGNSRVDPNDTASAINDPTTSDPVAFDISGVTPGSLLSFNATSVDCTNSTASGTPADNLNATHDGETYDHTSCTGTADGRIDSTTNATNDHEIYTDGDDLPTLDTAWWQPGIEAVLDTSDEDLYSGDEFTLDDSQAVVVVELDGNGDHTDYAVFLYDADAGDRGGYGDPDEDESTDGTNRYVIDITPTQVEVGDEE